MRGKKKGNRRAKPGIREVTKDLYERALQSAPNAVIIVDEHGRIILSNAQAGEMFGYPEDKLLGRPVEVLIPERFRTGHDDYRSGFMATPKTRAMGAGRDLYGLRIDGTEFPIEIGLNPVRTPNGLFVLASIIDITERKRAEERLRLVVEAAPNAMLMVGRDGRIVMVNAQVEQLFGYRRDELLREPVEKLVPGRFRGDHPEHRRSFFADPRVRAMGAGRDLFGLRKDGSEVPIEIGLNPIRTPEGLFTLASIIDITERKRAEARLRLVVEAAPNAMVMVDEHRRIVLVNRQAETLFGYERPELLGRELEMLVPLRYRKDHPGHVRAFLKKPEVRAMGAGRDLFGLRKDGSEVPIEIGLNPIETPEGKYTLASIIDITERQRLREAERLETRNDELEGLLHVISHDLKEPLRTIQNFSQIVAEEHRDALNEEANDYLGRVVRSATRMGRLLDDILALSRVRRIRPPEQTQDLGRLVEEALTRLEPKIRETKAKVNVLGPFEHWPVDPTWTVQAIYNLVGNALKFTRDDSPPDVEIAPLKDRLPPETIGLVVRDRGPGIPPELSERIFGLFQRAVGREIEGTGAGLAIVSGVARRHAGKSWVRPRPGGGSEFIITFGRLNTRKGGPDGD